MSEFRFVVSVMPRRGILDPQGRAVEASLAQLDAASVRDVRVGRRVELRVEAESQSTARTLVDRLARDLLANPLVEDWQVEVVTAPTAAEAAR